MRPLKEMVQYSESMEYGVWSTEPQKIETRNQPAGCPAWNGVMICRLVFC